MSRRRRFKKVKRLGEKYMDFLVREYGFTFRLPEDDKFLYDLIAGQPVKLIAKSKDLIIQLNKKVAYYNHLKYEQKIKKTAIWETMS